VHALPDEMRLHPSRKQRAEFTPRSDAIGIPRIAKRQPAERGADRSRVPAFHPLNGVKSTSAAASRRYKLRRRTIGHHSYRNISIGLQFATHPKISKLSSTTCVGRARH